MKVTARTTDAAVEQGLKVLANPNASAKQKTDAATTVATTVATDAARKAVRKHNKQIGETLRKYAPTLGGVGVAAAVAVKAAKAIPAQRQKEARAYADKELAKTKKRLPYPLGEREAGILWQQYYDHALKRPVENTYLGK